MGKFFSNFKITNIAIMENSETGQLFVSMPSYKTKELDENDKTIYRDICYPVTKEFREKLYGTILEMYQQEKEKRLQEGIPLNRRERMQAEMQEQEENDKTEKQQAKPKKGK